jgi:predicted RNA-binding Zn ribbon-like protein
MGQGVDTTSAPLLGEPLPVELMNTVWADREGVHDALGDGPGDWLRAEGLADRPVSEEVVRRFRDLRDALRCLAAEVAGDDRSIAASAILDVVTAVDAVNRARTAAPAWSEPTWGEKPSRVARSGHDDALAVLSRIAEQGLELFTDPRRPSLRACHAPGCVLYSVRDHPRREWCSASCGNRARVACRHQRHHAPPMPR